MPPIGIEDFNIQDYSVRVLNWRNLRRIDWLLPILVLTLAVAGWLTMYSASRATDIGFFHKQVAIFFVGLLIVGVVVAADYRFIVALAPVMYLGGLIALVAVLRVGHTAGGSERWLSLGPVGIQPSELMKIVMIYSLAWYLTRIGPRIKSIFWFALTFVIAGIPLFLILKQPNLGTAASLGPLAVVMLFVAGCRIRHLVLVALLGFSAVPALWWQIRDFDPAFRVTDADFDKSRDVSFEEFSKKYEARARRKAIVAAVEAGEAPSLKGCLYDLESPGLTLLDRDGDEAISEAEFFALDVNGDRKVDGEDKGRFELYHHQKERIYTFLHPEYDVRDSGWQTYQSKISVGSGGLSGKGYMNSSQTRLNYLPEHHTDFIFSMLAEEQGFIGVAIIIGLYLLFLLRGLAYAVDCPDLMGTLLAAGVVTILAFHVFVNIAITVGLLPVTGIPLPFLSYGRSFYVTSMICVGILLNVPMRRHFFVD